VNLALAYLTVPLVVIAAFRHQQAGASLSLFVLSAVAVWGTSHRSGPFIMSNLNESLLALQAFIGTIAATALITAAVVAERAADQKVIQAQLNDKEALLREVHHRVKNNLQVISSLLSMQANQADPKTAALLRDSMIRVRSMAVLHERLYASENFSHIDLSIYFKEMIKDLEKTYAPVQGGQIKVECICDPIFVSIEKAIPCGLLVNEVITNAFKHAFPHAHGEIGLKLKQNKGKVALEVFDTGIGLPETAALNGAETIGLKLISLLARQLDAELSIKRERGTAFHFEFEA
jgi:two-component sensor histidine kinase